MRLKTLTAAAAICTFAAPVFAQDSTTPAYDATTVVAQVNDHTITLGHMIALLDRLPERYRELGDEVLFPGILDQLIDQALISDSLSTATESDPARVRLTMENERWALLSNLVVEQIAAKGVSDEDLQAAYDNKYGDVEPTREFNASHILVETSEEALVLVESLNGGADFAELAKEKSTGPSGPNGGALGWFGLGAMVPPFEQAVVGMEVGAVSDPVQTQFGWHVIKLNETRDVPPPSLDDVRSELTDTLLRGVVDAELAGLRDAASVEKPEIDVPFSAIRDTGLLDE